MSLGTIFHFPLSFVFISMVLIIISMFVLMFPVEGFFTKERIQRLIKIIFYLLPFPLLLLLVIYVIYVIPYLFEKSKYVEKITPIIATIADIAGVLITVLLFYAAYKTLVEMEKQRNIANTPRLHVISSMNRISMESISISYEGDMLPVGWKSTKLPIEEKGRDILLEPDLDFLEPIIIANTGLSPALGVEIKWRLEDGYIKEISETFNEVFDNIRFEVQSSEEQYEMTVNCRVYRFTKELINKKYECVLSYSTKEDYIKKLHIPIELYVMKLIEMCGEYVKRDSLSSLGTPPSPQGVYAYKSAFKKISIPLSPLIADITYSDNISSKHKGELFVNFRLVVPNNRRNHEKILFKVGTLIVESELKYN